MAITPENYWPLGSTIQKTFTDLNVGSGYEFGGLMSVSPVDGNMVIFYRKGLSYSSDNGSIYIRNSTDGGANWSSESLVFSESGVDLRNLAGGYTSGGRLVIFYGRYQNQTTWLSINAIYSNDNGNTWSSPQSVYSQTGSAFSPYGHLIDLGQGFCYQTLYEVNSGTYSIKYFRSFSGGTYWEFPVSIYSGTLFLTEPSMLNLGGGNILVLTRINGGTCFAQFRSTDYGNTWISTTPEYTNFESWSNGQNMPFLSFINYQGTGIVACYYMRRDVSPYKLKVVYGLASKIMRDGITGWNSSTIREVCASTGGYRSGYQSFFHPNFQFKGIGSYFDCNSNSAHPVIVFPSINGMVNSVLPSLLNM